MSGDLGGSSNPTPWPAPPALGEQRLRSTTASPMQSPLPAAGGTLQAAHSPPSPPPPAAAADPIAVAAPSQSASSQQTLLRGSSSSSAAGMGGELNNNEVTSSNNEPPRRFLGGVVGLSRERTHHLRVRKRVPLAPSLTAELGVGTELMSGEITRHAALTYDVSDVGFLEKGAREEKVERKTKKERKTHPEKKNDFEQKQKTKKTSSSSSSTSRASTSSPFAPPRGSSRRPAPSLFLYLAPAPRPS